MHAIFVTAEITPYSGAGPAAEVCGALPKGLRSLDHAVTVVSPLYRSIDPDAHSLARRLSKVEVEVGGETQACEIYTGRTVSGVELIFLGHETLFHGTDDFELGDDETVARRAAVFARAAAKVVSDLEDVDLVHAHDWVGGAFLAALGETALPTVLTLHRGAEQRRFGGAVGELFGDAAADVDGAKAPLVAGLKRAQRVTVSSPRAADALRGTLADVMDPEALVGIPAGIDASIWNPLTDPHLPHRFDPVDLGGKAKCKAELQRDLELPVEAEVPMVALEERSNGAGLELFVKIASQILRNQVQLVFVAADSPEPLVERLDELDERWPDQAALLTEADEELRHQLVAAADLVLVAPETAPSGGPEMRAHRYGAVPIVHHVDALADSVVDCDAKLDTGTGFAFGAFDADEMLAAVRRALGAYRQPEAFEALQRRGMRVDHSWDRSARLYEGLYRELLESDG